MSNINKKYLKGFLKVAPLSHSLWRTCEAVMFHNISIKKPSLDIGCGFGEFAGVVFGKVEIGIDISKKDLLLAKKSKKYKKTMFADATSLPFKNNSFNTILSVSVLEHISNVEKAIEEISRVTKKGGVLYLTVPTSDLYKNLLFPKLLTKIGLGFLGEMYITKHKEVFKHISIHPKSWWLRKLKKNDFLIRTCYGTVSSKLIKYHELFLPFAIPSEIGKKINNRRFIAFKTLRSRLLVPLFYKITLPEYNSNINIFIAAQKK